jgi:hypothetical protein
LGFLSTQSGVKRRLFRVILPQFPSKLRAE